MYQFILLILWIINLCSTSPTGPRDSEISPQEIQHAICKISTKEIEATAKATITRQLKGVCSSNDMSHKFDLLHKDLQLIKETLGIPQTLKLKSLETPSLPIIDDYADYSDGDEVSTYNDTIVQSSDGELYFYYWRIEGVSKVLMKRDLYISSGAFSILGHVLHLQFYPNYLSEFIGILLKPESNSFLKKHKISILGQKNTQNEISSKKLYGVKNDEKMFKIESEMLSSDFISNDSLLIKVKVYLEG